MSYSFNPMTEEEMSGFEIVENGVYPFEVVKSTRKPSKAGNPMAELQLKIWDKNGNTHLIFNRLIFSTVKFNIRHVKHFCDSVGLVEDYNKGELPEELQGLKGNLELGYEESKPKDGGGYHPAKNIVIDYIAGEVKAIPVNTDGFVGDEIPF